MTSIPSTSIPSILHVDMDCFYAAAEIADDPSLAGRPVVVGGSGERGVVAACSYEARTYGVHSAMPTVQARRLCPPAVFLAGRYHRYAEVSDVFQSVLHDVTPVVETVALDEAYLDVSGARRLFGTGEEIARLLRAQVRERLGLECGVGVARSKLLAKLASRAAKPRIVAGEGGTWPGRVVPGPGVFVIPADEELAFLHPLPVGSLGGVGPATRRKLDGLGVVTVGDLARVPVASLVHVLGSAVGKQLHDLARARDPRPVVADAAAKSIGHEETFARDIRDRTRLHGELVRLADGVAQRMSSTGLAARTVSVKLRYSDFTGATRSETAGGPLVSGVEIAGIAHRLSEKLDLGTGVRLVGVSVSHLVPAGAATAVQLTLGSPEAPEEPAVWSAVTAVRRRFGEAAIGPARLVARSGLRVKRRGDTQWGPAAEE